MWIFMSGFSKPNRLTIDRGTDHAGESSEEGEKTKRRCEVVQPFLEKQHSLTIGKRKYDFSDYSQLCVSDFVWHLRLELHERLGLSIFRSYPSKSTRTIDVKEMYAAERQCCYKTEKGWRMDLTTTKKFVSI